jgi:hypothetical protein
LNGAGLKQQINRKTPQQTLFPNAAAAMLIQTAHGARAILQANNSGSVVIERQYFHIARHASRVSKDKNRKYLRSARRLISDAAVFVRFCANLQSFIDI